MWLVIMSVYVTSLTSGRGNSLITATLARAMQSRGIQSVAAAKPFTLDTTEVQPDEDLGALEGIGLSVLPEQVLVERTDGFIEKKLEIIQDVVTRITRHPGPVIMDGVPIGDVGYGVVTRELSLEVARLGNVPVIGIVDVGDDSFGGDLDSWSDYIEIANELENLFVGVILNKVPRYRAHWVESELVPQMESAGIQILSVVPESRSLASISVSQLAALVTGQVTHGQQYGERLVEHLMLGVNVVDSSIPYYQQRCNKAVIVRGDRPDLQMGALATNTSCLVLTGDKPPVQYIEYEADKVEVPIICTAKGTVEVVGLLGGWTNLGAFGYLTKVEELSLLLDQDLLLSKIHTG